MTGTGAEDLHLGVVDMALIPGFFISYSVLMLAQLGALFAAKWARFAIIAAVGLGAPLAVGVLDFTDLCDGLESAIICGNDAKGLSAFAWVWPVVSALALALFSWSRLLSAIRERSHGRRPSQAPPRPGPADALRRRGHGRRRHLRADRRGRG